MASVVGLLVLLPVPSATGADPLLSQVVAEGIGRKYPAGAGMLFYQDWPLPLHRLDGMMMTSAISSDGTLLATGCGHGFSPGQVVVWETASPTPRFVQSFPRGIRVVTFSKDGQSLVAAGWDNAARLLRASDGSVIREFRQHTDAIFTAALSNDGKLLVTGSQDNRVILWNVETGQVIRVLPGHPGGASAVALNSTGELLVSAGYDHHVRLWSVATGELKQDLVGPGAEILQAAFSPDGATFGVACWDKLVWLWATETGQEVARLGPAAARVCCLAFGPEPGQLLAGAFDGSLTQWDIAKQQEIRRSAVQQGATFAVSVSSDQSRIATSGWEGVSHLWNKEGVEQAQWQHSGRDLREMLHKVVWAPDESGLAALDAAGGVWWIDAANPAARKRRERENDRATAVVWDPQGRILYGTAEGIVERWDPSGTASEPIAKRPAAIAQLSMSIDGAVLACLDQTGAIQLLPPAGGAPTDVATAEPATAIAVAANGRWLAIGNKSGKVDIWDIAAGRSVGSSAPLGNAVLEIACSPGSDRIACVTDGPTALMALQFKDGMAMLAQPRFLASPGGSVSTAAYSADGATLVTGDRSGGLRLWARTGAGGQSLATRSKSPMKSVAIAPRSNRLASTDEMGSAWLWPVDPARKSIQPLASLPAYEKGARNVLLGDGDRRLVADSYDNQTTIWNLASGQREREFGAPEPTSATAVSRDGELLATAHFAGNRIQVMELVTNKKLLNIRGNPRGAHTLNFSPDRKRLVASFLQRGAMMYDLESDVADPIVTLPPDDLGYVFAAFSPDGSQFVTCTGDYKRQKTPGIVQLHDSKTGKLVREFTDHQAEVKSAWFDREGRRLATTAADKTIQIYDLKTGERSMTLQHKDSLFNAAFIPDSDLLLTADYRGNVLLWDLKTGAIVQQTPCHSDFINRVALSNDLSVLATAGRDGPVRLWKLDGKGNGLRLVDASP